MADKKVRMTVEFSIDEEALQERGISAEEVLRCLRFVEDDVVDGFRISTNIPGMSPVSNFFLCEGKVISKGFVQDYVKGDGLDWLRRMVVDELDSNGKAHGLLEGEGDHMMDTTDVIDRLAKKMEFYVGFGDRTEYDALEIVFREYFPVVLDEYREQQRIEMVDSLGLDGVFDAEIRGTSLFLSRAGAETEICKDEGGLYCRLPGEELYRPLRNHIQDIEAGDVFFDGNLGWMQVADGDAHQNLDESDNPWIVYGDEGNACYFEEDIGAELHGKVRVLLEFIALNKNKSSFAETLVAAKQRSEIFERKENAQYTPDVTLG